VPAALERAGDGDARGLIAMDAANNQETPPSPGMANLDRTKRPTLDGAPEKDVPARDRRLSGRLGTGEMAACAAARRQTSKSREGACSDAQANGTPPLRIDAVEVGSRRLNGS